MRSQRTPKLARDLIEFVPIRYAEYREYAKDGPSLYLLHLNGHAARTRTRRFRIDDPAKPLSDAFLEPAADCFSYVASADVGFVHRFLRNAVPVLIWLPGNPDPASLNGFTVLRHKRPQGVRRGLIALNYEPPLAHEKLERLEYEIAQPGRIAWASPQPGHGQRLRRWLRHNPPLIGIETLPKEHPAVVTGRTKYIKRVIDPNEAPRVLIPGQNSRKIGGMVVKGKWAGMPIYTVTLEERKTCWSGCAHWQDCYGNKMNWSRRLKTGPALERRIERELANLSDEHRDGFVVRLHVLGDFPSLTYIKRWRTWLRRFPQLRVFGYSSWPPTTPIGAAITSLRSEQWGRFAVRTSNAGLQRFGANTIYREPEGTVVPEGVVCPAQTDRTECCGTCGLCWQSEKSIAFIAH